MTDVRTALLELIHAGTGVQEFAARATRILSRSVAFDGVAVMPMDPATSLETGAVVKNGLPAEATARLLEIEHREGDVNTFVALARSGRLAASLDHETRGELDRSVRHRELRAPHGLGDELRTVLVSGSATWGGLTLGRSAGSAPFSAADVALMASVSRHLAEGLRRAILRSAFSEVPPQRSAGVMLLAADSTIADADCSAAAWLAELGPDPPVVAAVASRARSNPDRARARTQTPSGAWITVRASVLSREQTAVTIEPTRPDELAPLIADAYGLSRRERAVTLLVARGLQTEAVAGALGVSTWTVQDHLKSIFEKAGVSSRGELVARLFLIPGTWDGCSAAEPPPYRGHG